MKFSPQRDYAPLMVRKSGSHWTQRWGGLWAISGSQREERLEILDRSMAGTRHPTARALRLVHRDPGRYGTVPHAGFGLGFERTLAYVTGLANVRDATPFPRTRGNARYRQVGISIGRARRGAWCTATRSIPPQDRAAADNRVGP